jgi:beta-N-acetylhexosaminidase
LLDDDRSSPAAVVFGCEGRQLTSSEKELFEDADPLGFILFARNIDDPHQVRDLVKELRATVGRDEAIVMVDQEGGRVRRLRPPYWPDYPAMQPFGKRALEDLSEAAECVKLNYRMIADDLEALVIDFNCAPVLDRFTFDGHEIIGDRSFSDDPEVISFLGQAVCDGLTEGKVTPVVKHLPGHGRARVDSHAELPHVDLSFEILSQTDFIPFQALRKAAAGMTAHIVYDAIDPENPGSFSKLVVQGIIRDTIGFDGLLFSDDVCMNALSGPIDQRVTSVLAAGCDVALHCDGDLDAMKAIAESCPPMRVESMERLRRALPLASDSPLIDHDKAKRRISAFLDG